MTADRERRYATYEPTGRDRMLHPVRVVVGWVFWRPVNAVKLWREQRSQ